MSTLRVSNIEAKADVSSPSVHEKIKVTNSEGDVLVHIDGATSGISTVGINTTVKTFDVDSNQNIDFVGNLTAPNITVTGTLSYDDVTNIDSVGVITARSGLQVVAGNVGIDQANPTNKLEVEGSASVARFVGNRTDALGPRLSLAKSRGSTSGSATIVQDGDEIGQIMFKGADGTDADSTGAAIIARVNGTPGVNDMPGALTFLTTNDGTNSPTERLRITSGGLVGVNCTNIFSQFQVKGGTNANIGLTIMGGEASIEAFNDAGSANVPLRIRGTDIKFFSSSTERLRIASDGTVHINSPDSASGGRIYAASSKLYLQSGNGRQSFNIADMASGQSATHEFNSSGNLVLAGGMQAASVNLQSSSTNSWFQTGASYGGTDYVWAAKDSSANVWHSGLQTDGDLYLGGDITGTSYIKLNGSTGNATFIGKVDIGNQYTGGEIFKLGKSSGTSYTGYYNGGTANGFIGHADQLVSGGSGTDFAVRATANLIFANGATESVRITPSGYAYFGGYPTTHTVAGGSPVKVRSGAGAWGISLGMRYPNNDFAYFGFTDTNGTEQIAEIYSQRIGANNGHINFSTNNGSGSVTRARISNQGEFLTLGATYCIAARSAAGSSSVNTLYFGSHSSSSLNSGTITYEVYTNGNVKNTNNSYSQLSDERLKENIIDAPSQWDDIKSLRIRKYNFRDNNGYETHTQIGLVAQETESVCPGLVQETPVREDATPVLDADGNALETTKSVSTSVLYMKAVKALQEAQTRIETLETQLTDALARITALEG